MHKPTLYSVLALDILKKDLVDFPKFFQQHFTDQLLADQLITEGAKIMLEQDYGSITLKPTDGDRKVIGSMNDCIFRVRYYMGRDDEDGRSKRPTYIGHQFNKTPMGAIDYAHPVDMMRGFIERI